MQRIKNIANNIDNEELENITVTQQHKQNNEGVHQTPGLRLLVQAFNVDLYIMYLRENDYKCELE